MAIEVTRERRIPAPRDAVAAYATDPAHDPDWIGGITRVRVLTEGPFGVGTRLERTAGFLGRSFDYTLEVGEHDPGRLVAMRSVAGPFPMAVRYEFEDAAGGTLVRIRVSGEAGRYYRIAEPLVAAGVRRNLGRDLRRLGERMGRA
jgi:hypothetical protein